MRIERRVLVIETDHQSDVDDAVLHPVDETAAERIAVERPAERVDDACRLETIVGKLPQLLHAERIDLRILPAYRSNIAASCFVSVPRGPSARIVIFARMSTPGS